MAIVGVFIDLAMQYTNSIGRNVQRSILMRQAINVADSSTEMSFSAWRAICRQNQAKIYKRSDMDKEIPTPTRVTSPGSPFRSVTTASIPSTPIGNPRAGAPIAGPNHGDLSY